MSKFVIYTPNHGDYLVAFNEKGLGWNPDLQEAHFFRTFGQAERVAKHIAAQMRDHTDPYAIFIREVKEKNGAWKVKGEVEISPDPNRAEYFRQHPEMQGYDAPSQPLKPEMAPVKYVLYQPAKDDYLASIEEAGNFVKMAWAPHPQDALTYKNPGEAERKARELVSSHQYELLICELHRSENQYWVKSVKEIFPIDVSLN